jgi:hypothetical protein
MKNYKLTLAKELGRVPNEHEIGQKMLEVVSSHPKLKRKEKENKILDSSLAVQKNKDEANKHRRKDSIQATPRVRMINKMIHHKLKPTQIADILDLQLSTVQDTIYRYKLPREKVDLIPSKNKRVKGLEYSRNQV